MNLIVATIEQYGGLIQPHTISQINGLNPSTVRDYCRDLVEEGRILSPGYGWYQSLPTNGVGGIGVEVSSIKIHNICMVAVNDRLKGNYGLPVERFDFDGSSVSYKFGGKRGKFTCNIANDEGLDYNSAKLVVEKVWCDYVLRFEESPRFLCSFHLHRDVKELSLDGFSCGTLYELHSFISRIYRRKNGEIRFEHQFNNVSADDMLSLVNGDYSNEPRLRELEKGQKKIREDIAKIISQQSLIYTTLINLGAGIKDG